MFTFLEINTSISHIVMIYPLQFLLVSVLLALGLYELYYFLGIRKIFGIGKVFNRSGELSKKYFK